MTSTSPLNVLLVDDTPLNLQALTFQLEELVPNPLTAASGLEALRHFETSTIALVLLDVNMPGLDGFETARLIRQREDSRLTPIIFITATAPTPAEVLRGYEAGVVDFFIKPFVSQILREKVRFFLELAGFRSGLESEIGRRRAAEIELTQLNQRLEDLITHRNVVLESVLESVGDGVVVANAEGRIVTVNPAARRMFARAGVPQPESIVAGLDCFLAPGESTPIPAAELPMARALAGEPTDGVELHVCVRDCSEGIWLRAAGRPLRGPNRELLGGVVVYQDITVRKLTQLRLPKVLGA